MKDGRYETKIYQYTPEFDLFCRIIKSENVSSYLEIGSKHGGSIWRMAPYLQPGARVVSVDLPHGDLSFKECLPNLQACIATLKTKGFDAHLIVGDSTHEKVIDQVRALGPFDACFIDANHTLPFCTKDWETYGPMCRIVAFHDIAYLREGGTDSKKMPIQVPILWERIKKNYRHQEIRLDPVRFDPTIKKRSSDNGIGIIWRS